jgi:hypothetical protein
MDGVPSRINATEVGRLSTANSDPLRSPSVPLPGQSSLSCISSSVLSASLSASEGRFFLHQSSGIFCIARPAMAASNGLAYRPRIVDAELCACLGAAGAVVIEGPKACGKTRLAQQLAASTVLLDVDLAARQALAVDPALVLAGPRPRLLDEWQVAPVFWNQVRRAVDAVEAPGQFLHWGLELVQAIAQLQLGARPAVLPF